MGCISKLGSKHYNSINSTNILRTQLENELLFGEPSSKEAQVQKKRRLEALWLIPKEPNDQSHVKRLNEFTR